MDQTRAPLSARLLAIAGASALLVTAAAGSTLAQAEGEEGYNPYIEAGAAPDSGAGKKVGYISLGDRLPFVKLVTDNIKEQAELAGLDLVVCDGDVDATKSLECGRILGVQGVEGVISFNLFQDSSPEICASYNDVPTISIDIHQACEVSFYGANNFPAGEIAGRAAAEKMQAQDECQYDQIVTLETRDAGVVNEERIQGMLAGFASVCGEIPEDKLRREDVGGTTDLAIQKMNDVLPTLAPGSRTVILSLNDDMALGALSVFNQAGRTDEVRIAAQGADPSAWPEIACNPVWLADSTYFPERYGRTVVPAIIDILDGKEVPAIIFTPHIGVTADNIRDPETYAEAAASLEANPPC
jgi:ribose transport system substrate-binding protein